MGIREDHSRFRDIVRGRIKQNFKKYVTHGEMIGKRENEYVKIPIPSIDVPRFKYGPKQSGGVGQGQGQPGDATDGEQQPGQGQAGDTPGEHMLEADITLEELADILGEELQLPRIMPKGHKAVESKTTRYTGRSNVGPDSLRHFKASYKEALKRSIANGTYDAENPIVIPIKRDMRFRSYKTAVKPQANAVVIYMMDVSGSMGDEQKEIVRLESFWINTWLRRNYKGLETRFIIHDAAAKEVDEKTFFSTSESGGTLISSAYKLCKKIIDEEYPLNEWNVYPFHFSDGDNWSGEDTRLCVKLLKEYFLPNVNMFGYGQVESKYGSGQFLKDLEKSFPEDDRLVISRIENRDKIITSIKDFLGEGALSGMANLTPELERERVKIEKAARSVGLDFFETIFELVTYDQLNQIAAYGGFPVRYPHWRFGMEYESLSKSYEYGLSKIYELVINNDPCYAYLMEGNEHLDQKLVMAHVFGHCDFFKNNYWFSPTNRKMMDNTANHATRVRRYMDRYGVETVENFFDLCLSLENLIDRHSPYSAKKAPEPPKDLTKEDEEIDHHGEQGDGRLRVHRDYMDKYINPPEFLKEQQKRMAEERQSRSGTFPEKPERDVLNFLLHFAPLKPWQQDVLSIVREEAYYFSPQGMTKIMNEGWASYWHSKILTEQIMNDSEIIDFADRHSGTMAMSPTSFNPYKVGIELFRNIEERWNKGQFGREWDECPDLSQKKRWDTKAGKGREKIFEVRKHYNDVTFIDEFLTEDFCVEHKMFVYKFNKRTGQYEVDTRDFKQIKKKFLFQLTNFGQPIISVVDANHNNRGELLLAHMFEGVEMQPDYMQETMKNLCAIWGRPVAVATVLDGEPKIVSFDGTEFKHQNLSSLPVGDGNENKAERKD